MKTKIGRLALLLLIVVNFSALLTFAYNRWAPKPAGAPAAKDSFVRELCLSGTQEKCINGFRCAFDSETRDIRTKMQAKRLALVEELKKASPDGARLESLIEDISGLQAEIQKKAVENILKEKEVLTDEQKAKFFRLFQDHVCPRLERAEKGSGAGGRGGCPQGSPLRGNLNPGGM